MTIVRLLSGFLLAFAVLLILTYSEETQANTTYNNKELARSLAAKNKNYPYLGMLVVTSDEKSHTLISPNGRYVIKGTLSDMWEGVDGSFVEDFPINTAKADQIFEFMKKSDISITMGNMEGEPLDIFVSYSCKQCKEYIKQITQETFLSRYKLNVFIVFIDDLDRNMAMNVYCASDPIKEFYARYVERNIQDLDTSCSPQEPSMSVTYANLLRVRSLPATLPTSKKLHYGTLPNKF
jgi:hypothetical protein